MRTSDENDTRESNKEYTIPESKTQKAIRALFGVIMIIIYVGMGVLLLINFFNWNADWAWTRYVVGVVLIIYGFFRAYRQIKGID